MTCVTKKINDVGEYTTEVYGNDDKQIMKIHYLEPDGEKAPPLLLVLLKGELPPLSIVPSDKYQVTVETATSEECIVILSPVAIITWRKVDDDF